MRRLKWLLLGFHVLLITALTLGPIWLLISDIDEMLLWLGLASLHVVLQVVFIFAPGPLMYLAKVPRRRVILLSIVAGLMLATLIAGLGVALTELFEWHNKAFDWPEIWWVGVVLVWIACSFLLFVYSLGLDRIALVKRVFTVILASSLLQLIATIPSHVIASRRPDCMAGCWTGLGMFSGLYVLTWVFGPGILLLFLLQTRKRMAGHCLYCGYNLRGLTVPRCPECGQPFTLESDGHKMSASQHTAISTSAITSAGE